MTTQFMIKPTQTSNLTSKAEAYRTLLKSQREESNDDVNEALDHLGVLAARKAVLFIGQYYGMVWMEKNRGWKQAEFIRACSVIEHTLGRTLTGFQRNIVHRGMKPILDDAI